MGFGGSVQGMITSLKNNSRRGKRVNYFDKGYKATSENNSGIPVKKISAKKLRTIKKKIKEENRKEEVRIWLIFSIVFTVIIAFSIKFIFF
ncbi:hypothetical protein SAMN04488096_103347 [Mesonia phycicola]|uniref:Uncharacterized protein n=1 Tax=Mesonia phycicola TaxID=579105 RepID=A0A1M6D844_9FLAO|nr:hypothetical protein [Mesonia phycicola]SHI69331.1 hypothetical protein SAMN04488096_103347 [Mesonia phycicola]